MSTINRSNVTGGVLLILLGAFFLLAQWFPNIAWFANPALNWPLTVIGVGVVFLFVAIIARTPSFAIPASIVGGVGVLLYWQNATGNWDSWGYTWTLIPGFVGVGLVLTALLGSQRHTIQAGLWLMVISALMFIAFASLFGELGLMGAYWPVALIVLGLLLIARPLFPTLFRNDVRS